jgi:uncharacterized protein (DUF427 family)
MARKRLKKVLIIIAVAIVAFIVLLVVVASPVAKYMVEKYDEKFTGRQIDVGWIYLNPLTGYMHIQNLKVFEKNKNNIFFSAGGISVNVTLRKLFSKTYEISRFKLDNLKVRILQDGDKFNFTDIVEKFASSDTVPKTDTAAVRFSIKNVRIRNGEIHYNEKQAPIDYFIKQVNIDSKGKTWDVDTVNVKYSFLSGPGSGSIKGDLIFNFASQDYRAGIVIDKFDLKIVEQYMLEMANYGKLKATLDANIQTSGNLNDSMSMSSKGRIAVSNFHFGKSDKEDYFSFDKLVIKIHQMNLQKGVRESDTIMLVKPEMKYERYDQLDNIQRMFGVKGEKIDSVKSEPKKFNLILELADYIRMLSKTFKEDYFKINTFAIEEANIAFNDFSLTEKFSMAFNPFTITADSIDKNRSKIRIKVTSGIQPHGNFNATLSVNPKNTGYFDLSYKMQDVPAALFNPYLISYTSFPLDRGSIEFHGNWNVDNSVINSENHFIVVDPRVSKKIRKKDNKWIPMPLIMAFVRERGNVIDYEIPIKGNLKDPKFKIADILNDLLKNIFFKPPTTPYLFEVRNTENTVEKSLSIKWVMRTATLLPNQEKFIEKMAEFLKDNSEATLTINPMVYTEKEKEHILLYEAKRKYFLEKNKIAKLGEEDSLELEKMSVKDSSFVRYLNAYVKDSSLFTIQQKCRVFLGNKLIQEKYANLIQQREKAFLKYFKENGTDNQIKIQSTDNTVPFNGFSYYKISYKGDIPDDLMKAYQKMEEFNDENPRKRYKQWRE